MQDRVNPQMVPTPWSLLLVRHALIVSLLTVGYYVWYGLSEFEIWPCDRFNALANGITQGIDDENLSWACDILIRTTPPLILGGILSSVLLDVRHLTWWTIGLSLAIMLPWALNSADIEWTYIDVDTEETRVSWNVVAGRSALIVATFIIPSIAGCAGRIITRVIWRWPGRTPA